MNAKSLNLRREELLMKALNIKRNTMIFSDQKRRPFYHKRRTGQLVEKNQTKRNLSTFP